MNSLRYIIGAIFLSLLPVCGRAGEALDSFFSAVEQQTLHSDFTVTVTEEVAQPMNYPGTITMHGRLFRLSMFSTEAVYDGKTLYLYDESTDELTLSYPTEDELLEANPFLFAQALVKVCTVTEHSSKDGEQVIVTLTPKDQSLGIQRFTLRLKKNGTTSPQQKTQYIPISVEVKEGKRTTLLTLRSPTYAEPTPAFTLSYPNAYLNDLR